MPAEKAGRIFITIHNHIKIVLGVGAVTASFGPVSFYGGFFPASNGFSYAVLDDRNVFCVIFF